MTLCVKYQFLGAWQAFITEDLPSPECNFQQNTTVSDIFKGAGKSRLWKLTWEDLG